MAGRASLSPLVLVAVVLAILVGIVGAVLVGGVAAPAPSPHAGELIITLPDQVWGLLFLSPLLVGLLTLILRRIFAQSVKFSRHSLLQLLAVLGIVLLFLYLLSVANPGSTGQVTVVGTGSPPPHNNTTHSGNGTNTTPAHNSSLPGSSFSFQVPSWGLLAIVAAVSLCVAVVAIPGVLALLGGRRGRAGWGAGSSAATDQEESRQAIAEASAAIDRGDDPRTTIVRLYARLLGRLGPRLGDADNLTAEEIRVVVLSTLNVRPVAAEALTRLFEEARYSLHPMGPDAADRCRAALASVEADLARIPLAS